MIDYCKHEPPLDVCISRDWSARETTPDQLRIEQVLESYANPSARWLHVGIGNSSLAKRFCARVDRVVGISVTDNEIKLAHLLKLPNHEVIYLNKYSKNFTLFEGPYDVIIDNNPTSFACCWYHLGRYFAHLAKLLTKGGVMLTDTTGLEYCEPYSESFTPEKFRLQVNLFGLRMEAVTDWVWGLTPSQRYI
jgi:hypothetical protein